MVGDFALAPGHLGYYIVRLWLLFKSCVLLDPAWRCSSWWRELQPPSCQVAVIVQEGGILAGQGGNSDSPPGQHNYLPACEREEVPLQGSPCDLTDLVEGWPCYSWGVEIFLCILSNVHPLIPPSKQGEGQLIPTRWGGSPVFQVVSLTAQQGWSHIPSLSLHRHHPLGKVGASQTAWGALHSLFAVLGGSPVYGHSFLCGVWMEKNHYWQNIFCLVWLPFPGLSAGRAGFYWGLFWSVSIGVSRTVFSSIHSGTLEVEKRTQGTHHWVILLVLRCLSHSTTTSPPFRVFIYIFYMMSRDICCT